MAGDIEKLDMSLDDIIKKSADKKPKTPGGASQRTRIQQKRRGGPVAARGRGGRGPKAVNKVTRAPLSLPGRGGRAGIRGGGIGMRGRGVQKVSGRMRGGLRGRGGGLRRGAAVGPGRRFAGRGRDAFAGNAKWAHDLYEQGVARNAAGQRQQGATLLISNLNYNVSDDDIKELFSSIGPLVSFGVNYDRSGRSEGTAQVVYRHKEHAIAAMKRYNNVALDNLKMVISLREPSNPNVLTTLSSGISVTSLGRGGHAPRAAQPAARIQPAFGGRAGTRGRSARGGLRGRGGRGQGRAAGVKSGPEAMAVDG